MLERERTGAGGGAGNLQPLPPVLEAALGAGALAEYLLKPERLSIHRWERSARHWRREPEPLALLHAGEPRPATALEADRDPRTGEVIGWKEVPLDEDVRPGDLSMSSRAPLPPHLATRGSASQLPFLPAGFEEEQYKLLLADVGIGSTLNPADDTPGKFLGEDLLCSAFDEIISFAADGFTLLDQMEEMDAPPQKDALEVKNVDFNLDFEDMIDKDYRLKGFWTDSDDTPTQNQSQSERTISEPKRSHDNPELDTYLDTDEVKQKVLEIVNISQAPARPAATSTEWAEMIDISLPVSQEEFVAKVPEMAHKFPFELDTFQKQAIIKLEEGNHVFVAAHTSAGKTVVAEYAIALSQNHCTRTIYTSPIKALSNQKYNDFRRTFGDVGLLTGDLQINPTAACLVMTTEILKSMLYCGSDVTRDLEFVIFDEVHYINNAERGHVWEEVLILLPAHVVIVLLSATVPNTLQFADWVGRTKKRKVYVVSTPKRPVPLCHYLYTGTGGKSKHERFMVVDQDGNFLLRGYNDAVAAKESRQNDFKKNFGPKGGKQYLNPKQEQTMWVAFIDHLQSNDKLPVVAFTLSRNRCDQNAESLMSIDLTTAREKSHIHTFFQRCLQRLKEPDRKLPQVVRLQRVLMNGVGVHHSGILPLLKEIVEMLFQSGHVKILFATETFAMGVNMPARTVVFDEIKKFDGVERRNLAPAEYIQMAGRAGRRGLDATGTVIILCKDGVPELMHLKEMMLGTPQKLSSQFRLTYAMILSLLRVATVSVEGMMQRSFREFHQQCQADGYRKQLEQAEKQYTEICSTPLPSHLTALAAFYDTASAYIEESADIMPILLGQSKIAKELVAGKVLLVSVGPYINQLAVFLNSDGPRLTPYKMLLLDTAKNNPDATAYKFDVDDNWYRMLSLSASYNYIGTEETTQEHIILCAAPKNILKVTKMSIKLDPKGIILDWEKRQMPRFKDAAVGATCAQVVQELSRMSHAVYSGATELEEISLTKSLAIKDGEILEALDRISKLKVQLEAQKKCTDIANFKSEFAVIYERKQAEQKRDKLRRLLSYENMALYPDYLRRLEVLRELRYIDEEHRVLIKGRVACEMGTNELIITELVFRNTLTNLEPSEIAALLSCLVFQARTQVETVLTRTSLKNGVAAIQQVDDELRNIESRYLVGQFDALGDRLNFGLVRVVYEWAQAKPFAEIMDLTDVQEGIIVRCIQQLNEVLIDVRDAAKIIGDPKLYNKMQEASLAIKRDIVFAASLYTTQKEAGL